MTTPGVTWIYPVHYQRAAAQRALAKEKKLKGDIEQLGGSTDALDTNNKGFMLCLDKIQNLPAMMTFLEMLNHAVPKRQDSVGAHAHHGHAHAHGPDLDYLNNTQTIERSQSIAGPKLLALRLLHLTERSSSVLLAATERAEVLRRDTLMTVFQAFAKLNNILVRPRMTLSTDPEDFALSIYDEAVESGTRVIIFPWNSTSLPDPPMHFSDDHQEPVLSRPLVSSNTQVVNRLLTATATKDVVTAIFVDREFGGSGHFMNIMVPLYGSPDDEEALKLASALSHDRLCTIQIVRIESSNRTMTKEALEVRQDVDNQSIDSLDNHPDVPTIPEDNQTLVHTYFPHRAYQDHKKAHRRPNSQTSDAVAPSAEVGESIFVHVVATLHDAIGLSKTMLGSRDLLVLGRGLTSKKGRHSSAVSTHEAMGGPSQPPQVTRRSSAQALTTAFQLNAPANSPGLQLQSLPTGFTLSTSGTPTYPIDNPLDGSPAAAGASNLGGLRPRHQIRTQPSSRDLQHSFLTVQTILGVVSQQYLSSEVACCLLVVQAGSKQATGAGAAISRVASSVIQGSVREPASGNVGASLTVPRGPNRPLGFESEHSGSHEFKG
ncbi:K(+)/H(+) antiporter [Podila epigama]|nr:K(+)/H(+) antiporter [Podila epigama]